MHPICKNEVLVCHERETINRSMIIIFTVFPLKKRMILRHFLKIENLMKYR